jgi:curved DNA-binding protein CbpA
VKSAYQVLGVPGNATAADIEEAVERARAFYTPQKMAEDSRFAEQLSEVNDAHKVLRDPESRQAHDRKLARQASSPPSRPAPYTATVVERESGMPRALVIIGLLAISLFAGGAYVQHRRQAAQAEIAAKQLEAARQQAIAEAESRQAAEQETREKARREADQLAQDRAFRRESDAAIARAQNLQARQDSLNAQQRAAELREEQRKASELRADEQRRINESQRRVAADRQRIRELCYVNYRRYDC